MAGLEGRLRAAVRGEVRFDRQARAMWAGDASNHRVPPLGVVLPATTDDVIATMQACAEAGVPVTPRGGGTSVVGNAIGPGVVIDTSKHLTRIHGIDSAARVAYVEPGVVLDDLQRAAARHGLRFGPDPSSRSRCTVGGMVGNNACGARSVAWGTTASNTRSLDVLTIGGTRFTAAGVDAAPIHVATAVDALVSGNLALVRTALPHWERRSSGYALQHLLPEHGASLARALVGSEGSCVAVLGAELQLVPAPAAVALAVLGHDDAPSAADAAPALLAAGPLTVEGIDARLVDAVHARGRRTALPDGRAWLLVEVAGADAADAAARATALARDSGRPHVVLTDAAAQRAVWRIREEGAGLATRAADGGEAWPGWEDATVPPERLGDYLRAFDDLQRAHGLRGAVYGHFGEGCVHVRLDFDLRTAPGIRRYRAFLEQAATLVATYGGSLSGEHADGRARGELATRIFPASVLRLFERFKGIFDPHGLMNPGVGVRPARLDADLRWAPHVAPPRNVARANVAEPAVPAVSAAATPATAQPVFLGLPADGGDLARAVRRCVGVGTCRRDDPAGPGVMCPSFAVTHDEQHSTRGRARLLAEMIDGRLLTDGWRSPEVRDALDLCLGCKGCRSDCPVGVDMATYKAEHLHHNRTTRDQRVMGALPRLTRLAPSRLAHAVASSRALGGLLARAAGVTTERPLPVPARQSLRSWLRSRPRPAGAPPRGDVVLFTDTFTDLFDPHVGRAAVELLESVGFRVVVPRRPVCCGLTWFSSGRLPQARRVLARTLDTLAPHLDAGTPVVGLEPSCTAALRSDAHELLPHDPRVPVLHRATHTLAELLTTRAPDWTPRVVRQRAVVQTHCHQHAVLGADADAALLARAGVDVVARPSGCCGLAGSFGYQRGHEAMSTALAERSLLPAIRGAGHDAVLLADGFSCRLQARQHADVQPVHLAELLAP